MLNILGRRLEGYHAKLSRALATAPADSGGKPVSIHELTALKSTGLETLLNYDRFVRGAFVDHFVDENVQLEALEQGRFDERGDFAGAEYTIGGSAPGRVTLTRNGHVNGRPLTLHKTC